MRCLCLIMWKMFFIGSLFRMQRRIISPEAVGLWKLYSMWLIMLNMFWILQQMQELRSRLLTFCERFLFESLENWRTTLAWRCSLKFLECLQVCKKRVAQVDRIRCSEWFQIFCDHRSPRGIDFAEFLLGCSGEQWSRLNLWDVPKSVV